MKKSLAKLAIKYTPNTFGKDILKSRRLIKRIDAGMASKFTKFEKGIGLSSLAKNAKRTPKKSNLIKDLIKDVKNLKHEL